MTVNIPTWAILAFLAFIALTLIALALCMGVVAGRADEWDDR